MAKAVELKHRRKDQGGKGQDFTFSLHVALFKPSPQ